MSALKDETIELTLEGPPNPGGLSPFFVPAKHFTVIDDWIYLSNDRMRRQIFFVAPLWIAAALGVRWAALDYGWIEPSLLNWLTLVVVFVPVLVSVLYLPAKCRWRINPSTGWASVTRKYFGFTLEDTQYCAEAFVRIRIKANPKEEEPDFDIFAFKYIDSEGCLRRRSVSWEFGNNHRAITRLMEAVTELRKLNSERSH